MAELKKAYRHALMVWHPGRFTGDEELRAKAHARTYLRAPLKTHYAQTTLLCEERRVIASR